MIKQIFIVLSLVISLDGFAGDAGSKMRQVTIIQTTDIHSHLLPDAESPGWLALATIVRKKIEDAGGKDSCLLIDCGDTIQGSVPAIVSNGMAGITMLNSLGYDAWIPGNHETDFGFKRFVELAKDFKGDIISLNLSTDKTVPWTIYAKNGLKIAVAGITYSYMDSKPSPSELLEKAAGEITAMKPDIFILAIHNGLSFRKDNDNLDPASIARTYPQIDLVLGGHTHVENPGEKIGSSSWFVQPGKHAQCFAEITVTFNEKDKKVWKITSNLVYAQKDTKPDATCLADVSEWIKMAKAYSRKKIGTLEQPINSEPENPASPLNLLFWKALTTEFPATDAVLTSAMSPEKSLDQVITGQDLFDLAPYEDTVCIMKVTGREIREIMQEQKKHKTNSEKLLFKWNPDLPDAPGEKTAKEVPESKKTEGENSSDLLDSGKLDDNNVYTVALSSYAASGCGFRFKKLRKIAKSPKAELKDTGTYVRDALEKYLRK